jgi:S1-C subfamily serine protease
MTPWNRRVALVIGLLLAGVLLLGQPALAQTPEAMTATESTAVEQVVELVEPAVVTVINEQTVAPPGGGQSQLQPVGSGSGFIIDDQGHIVTNHHVVAGGESFLVSFYDQSVHSAQLIGADPVSDLAVLQVSEAVPGTVAIADSSQLALGQSVVAIGSPLGTFTNTVTAGIISGLNRSFPEGQAGSGQPADTVYTDLIQHTATINPGNSGGPLLDLTGKVVGVNTLTIPTVPGENIPAQGLFFALPGERVQAIVDRLIESGSVDYPLLGIPGSVPIDPETAAVYSLPVDYGVLVTTVTPGSPAEAAGIKVDDIVLAIDGQKIDFQTPLTDILFTYAPGDEVTVTVQRGADQLDVKATLATRPVPQATPVT